MATDRVPRTHAFNGERHGAMYRAGNAVRRRALREGFLESSNLVAPIILRNEPFGEYAEGLFHCEDASYRSTSVFKWYCTMVELTRRSDGTPLFAWRNVVQIPSLILAVADRSFEAELLRQCFYGCRHRCSEHCDLDSLCHQGTAVNEPRG